MRHTGLGVVRHRAAELFEGRLLAGDGLDHVRAGDEHVAGLFDHEDEVGHRRRVDGAAGAGSHDHADLRHDAAALDVAGEDLAVAGERDDAFLDARSAGVVDADHRAADALGQIHDLAHLLAHDLAERAAEDGEVLREDADRTTVDQAVAGDDGVAPRTVLLHREVVGAVAHEGVDLLERAGVEQLVDALARGQLALGVLLLDRDLVVVRAGAQLIELLDLLFVCLGHFLSHGGRSVCATAQIMWSDRAGSCAIAAFLRQSAPNGRLGRRKRRIADGSTV